MNLISFKHDQMPDQHEEGVDALLKEAYGSEPEPHRVFLTLDNDKKVIGHLAAYTRAIEIGGVEITIGMIGDVATKMEHRRKGIAKDLVVSAHNYFQEQSIEYAVLFAFEPKFYVSSGYNDITNQIRFLDNNDEWKTLVCPGSMYCELADKPWPDGLVDLKGPTV